MMVSTVIVGIFKKEGAESEIDIDDYEPREEKVVEVGGWKVDDCKGKKDMEQGKTTKTNKKNDDEEAISTAKAPPTLKETYSLLFRVMKLPPVKTLFLILLTYRFCTSLSDNVKTLKYIEYGLPKSTIAFLSPVVVLPLGIATPLYANRIWKGRPLDQFLFAFKFRVFFLPLLDCLSLYLVKHNIESHYTSTLCAVVLSTIGQTILSSLMFNAQMTFFAEKVDESIGGTYMTLLNTAGNLGGTWPASPALWIVGALRLGGGRDSYFYIQACLSCLGGLWIFLMEEKVRVLGKVEASQWKTK